MNSEVAIVATYMQYFADNVKCVYVISRIEFYSF
jgi:hypothetical protein